MRQRNSRNTTSNGERYSDVHRSNQGMLTVIALEHFDGRVQRFGRWADDKAWRSHAQIVRPSLNSTTLVKYPCLLIACTTSSRALKAATTFHELAIQADTHNRRDFQLNAQRKVLDNLTLCHILCTYFLQANPHELTPQVKLDGAHKDQRLPKDKEWFAQAVSTLTANRDDSMNGKKADSVPMLQHEPQILTVVTPSSTPMARMTEEGSKSTSEDVDLAI